MRICYKYLTVAQLKVRKPHFRLTGELLVGAVEFGGDGPGNQRNHAMVIPEVFFSTSVFIDRFDGDCCFKDTSPTIHFLD